MRDTWKRGEFLIGTALSAGNLLAAEAARAAGLPGSQPCAPVDPSLFAGKKNRGEEKREVP